MLTQADVADRIGELNTHKVGRWERGEQMPGARPRTALAALWGVPPWEPEAGLAGLPEFAAWIARHASGDARDPLLSALGQSGVLLGEGPEEDTASGPEAPLVHMPQRPPAFVPRQLPNGTVHFIGRTAELAQLSAVLDTAVDDRPAALLIAAIVGTAGVGKTELAIHWAHRVRERFPDGDLYVNLGGEELGGPSVDPDDALSALLQALQVPGDRIPLDLMAKVGLYRSLLAGKRLLIVLDNAAGAAQVRPLLPGGGACMVLVTSRNRLPGLAVREGVQRVSLGPFSPQEGLTLLRHVVGRQRIDAEREAARTIVHDCASLPLALRIAADWMALHPHLPLAALAAELADESRRLGVLKVWDNGNALGNCLWLPSYRALSEGAKRAFRLVGVLTGPDISLPAAMALMDSDATTTRGWLTELTNLHLLEQTAVDRYQAHGLLRLFAAAMARAEEPAVSVTMAIRRLLTWYERTAEAVEVASARESLAGTQAAPRWTERERENLIAAVRLAEACGLDEAARPLAALLRGRAQGAAPRR